MLTLNIQRDVKPSEVTSLVFGTGALTMPWWHAAQWRRNGKPFDGDILSDAEDGDTIWLRYDQEDAREGDGNGRVELTLQQLVDASAVAIRKGYVYEPDAIKDDLGYCDAIQADVVMQLAVFQREEPIYG
jgi:hypothetical protein